MDGSNFIGTTSSLIILFPPPGFKHCAVLLIFDLFAVLFHRLPCIVKIWTALLILYPATLQCIKQRLQHVQLRRRD